MINEIDISENQIRLNIKTAQEQQLDLIECSNEIREQELLDYHNIKVGNKTVKEKLLRKKLLKKIKKD